MSGPSVPPSARIATALNGLQPTERRVADIILGDPAQVVEWTAQELADRAGVGRSSVIRACQSFGYRGFPQLRVALAAELGRQPDAPAEEGDDTTVGLMRAEFHRIAQALPAAISLLDEDTVEAAVRRIVSARRLMVVANGLSGPIASELAMRLTAIGRPAEFTPDAIAQQIAASGLTGEDACIVVSGSGANESSLKAADAAAGAATVIALTSFAASPLTVIADLSLVIASAGVTFRDELEHTSRVAHAVFVEALVAAVARSVGDASRATRARVLEILSDNLADAAD
ncbi:MurR/RpiR family transcriptional regulator [Microbacterium gorillae]|uniref:MurR/RpiR family transcriptional regulator n=1 Tax=Microbacterium gorillae TaxID=1231063 RepID=UPI00058B8391|nr:MurR/RpiR family transcriptional regulator [Microbacterium gorillae]